VLRAHPRALRAVVLEGAAAQGPTLPAEELLAALSRPAPPPDGAPVAAPSEAELLLLERQVAAPLLSAAAPTEASASEAAAREDDLRWAARMAGLMGLELRPVEGCAAQPRRCWLVAASEPRRGGLGAGLLVREGGAPFGVEAPAAAREAGSLPVALEVWAASGARALLYAEPPAQTAEPLVTSPGHFRTGFQAFHQALHRALPADGGLLLQIRGFADRPSIASEVLVELDGPVLTPAQRPRALETLLAAGGALGWMAPLVRYHDGSPELAGLSNAGPQQAFSSTFGGVPFATLWLSEHLRAAYVLPRASEEQLALAGLGGLPPASSSPLQSLLTPGLQPLDGTVPAVLRERFERLAAAAERRLRQHNIHDLRALARVQRAGAASERVELGFSREHGLPFLLLEARQGRRVLRGLYFLQEQLSPLPRVELAAGAPALREAVQRALRQCAPVLLAAQLPTPSRSSATPAAAREEVRP
jgi:hypothetical protein